MRGLILRLKGRNPEYPRWYRLCWRNDYRMVHVVAPIGVHWLLIAARWLYKGVEFRWPLALQEPERYRSEPRRWPFLQAVEGDAVAGLSHHGLCWEEGSLDGPFRRYIAPIGLNLIYALYRRYGAVVPTALLIVVLLAACSSAPARPVDAQCNPMCWVPCTTDGDTGVRWESEPDDAEAWDSLGGEVVPALVDLANTCETRRRACDQCLRRLDDAGLIRI